MKLTVYKGLHEIGGSCVEVKSGGSRIVIDVGIPLVDRDGDRIAVPREGDVSGPELLERGLLPNVSGMYEWDTSGEPVDGVLISHAHMDHYGWIRFVRKDIPVYLGEATNALIELGSMMTRSSAEIHNPHFFDSGKPFECGEFVVTPFLVDHSAFDAYAFVVEADGNKVIYSGDVRTHGRKPGTLRQFLRKAPRDADALILEGTLMGNEGHDTVTERDIEDQATAIAKESQNAILLHFSSQNIDRLVSFYRAAIRSDRTFVVDVYTALLLDTLVKTSSHPKLPHPSSSYKNMRVMFPPNVNDRLKEHHGEEILFKFAPYKITKEQISQERSKIMMMVKPSIVRSFLRDISGLEGATFVYSLWRGYLDEPGTKKFKDYIDGLNMTWKFLHTSGHAPPEALREIVDTLRPKTVVPIHTLHPEKYQTFSAPVTTLSPGQTLDL